MSLIDPSDPPAVQIAKQGKIIDALMRQAGRKDDVGPSAFRAFQSAIDLQEQVAAQSRDLARVETELASVRYERARMRRKLVEALSSIGEGFAMFTDRYLDLYNDLFTRLMPDIAVQVQPGLSLAQVFDLISSSAHVVSDVDDLRAMAERLGGDLRDGETTSLTIAFTHDRWYQLNAQQTSPGNLFLLLTDITEIVRSNRQEKKTLIDLQEDYLQAVFQNMESGICTFSAAGAAMMHNARFGDILGIPGGVIKSGVSISDILQFMSGAGLIDTQTVLKADQWRHELTVHGWLRRRVGYGANRVIDIHAHALPDRGYLVEIKDATLEARAKETLENRVMERTAELTRANAQLVEEYEKIARVEEELRLAKERAEAAVSSKTRFLAAASHDLLQPVNAAKLLISTLREVISDPDHARIVDRLNGAFSSAEQLLQALLDISRLESADPDAVSPTDVSLARIMESVLADQALLAEQKDVRLDMVASSAYVRSDPIYLMRSLQNLVVNAIQYTEPGGRVLVGCRRRGDRIVLEVWDTGIGIARKDQARIFEEFTRADNVPVGSGMGLGLSVVDRACRLLEHSLTLRSKPGLGTVMSIEMQTVPRPADAQGPEQPIPEQEVLLDHVILLIENDPDVLYGMTLWLEECGASVLAARSSAEAMQMTRDMGMPPDIILADFDLDDGDNGLAAISRLRTETDTQIPAILVTADRRESLRQMALTQDVSLMTKPVRPSRLRAQISWKMQ